MSRDDVSSFLHALQLSIDSLQRRIDQSLVQLQHTKSKDLPQFLSEERQRFISWHQEQLNSLDQLYDILSISASTDPSPRETDDDHFEEDHHTPFGVHLRSLEQRVTAMGGIPALGSVVLPRNTIAGKPTLKATSSAAAVEILHRSLHHHAIQPDQDNISPDDDSTNGVKNNQKRPTTMKDAFSPLRKVNDCEEKNTAAAASHDDFPHMKLHHVALRKVGIPHDDASSKKKEKEALDSELAMILQKRAQKQLPE